MTKLYLKKNPHNLIIQINKLTHVCPHVIVSGLASRWLRVAGNGFWVQVALGCPGASRDQFHIRVRGQGRDGRSNGTRLQYPQLSF